MGAVSESLIGVFNQHSQKWQKTWYEFMGKYENIEDTDNLVEFDDLESDSGFSSNSTDIANKPCLGTELENIICKLKPPNMQSDEFSLNLDCYSDDTDSSFPVKKQDGSYQSEIICSSNSVRKTKNRRTRLNPTKVLKSNVQLFVRKRKSKNKLQKRLTNIWDQLFETPKKVAEIVANYNTKLTAVQVALIKKYLETHLKLDFTSVLKKSVESKILELPTATEYKTRLEDVSKTLLRFLPSKMILDYTSNLLECDQRLIRKKTKLLDLMVEREERRKTGEDVWEINQEILLEYEKLQKSYGTTNMFLYLLYHHKVLEIKYHKKRNILFQGAPAKKNK